MQSCADLHQSLEFPSCTEVKKSEISVMSHDMSSDDNKFMHYLHDIGQQVVGFFRDRVSELRTAVSGCGQSSVPEALQSNRSNGWADPSHKRVESGRIAESSNSRTASFLSDQAAPLARHGFSTSVTKEDLGRATWLLLHTIAAQYPANPSKQQRKDVAALVRWPVCWKLVTLHNNDTDLDDRTIVQVDTLTRIYPCGECAVHFQDLVR